jgi:hypothetical protein
MKLLNISSLECVFKKLLFFLINPKVLLYMYVAVAWVQIPRVQ